jgi:hypothetical protein
MINWILNIIGWGEVYEVSWWGQGVDNNIGWGSVYQNEAYADVWNYQMSLWQDENTIWDEM